MKKIAMVLCIALLAISLCGCISKTGTSAAPAASSAAAPTVTGSAAASGTKPASSLAAGVASAVPSAVAGTDKTAGAGQATGAATATPGQQASTKQPQATQQASKTDFLRLAAITSASGNSIEVAYKTFVSPPVEEGEPSYDVIDDGESATLTLSADAEIYFPTDENIAQNEKISTAQFATRWAAYEELRNDHPLFSVSVSGGVVTELKYFYLP